MKPRDFNPMAGLMLAALLGQGLSGRIIKDENDLMFFASNKPPRVKGPNKGTYVPEDKPHKKFRHNRRG